MQIMSYSTNNAKSGRTCGSGKNISNVAESSIK